MSKFLFWLTSFLPMRIISDGEQPYLERYYLFTILGWRFYIHRFVASDPDRGLHDHPWSKAFSIVLSGYYWEETRSGTRKVRWFNSLTGDTFHRVVLPFKYEEYKCLKGDFGGYVEGDVIHKRVDFSCWTLFFHSTPDVKRWGFMRPLREQLPHDAQLFEPYAYQHEQGKKPMWWKEAKRRGEV